MEVFPLVFDKLENASLYYGLGPRFRKALAWLAQVDPSSLPSGQRVDIQGDDIYATRFDVDTKPASEAKLECHRNYADIQYVVSGTEGVGYSLPDAPLKQLSEYQPDIQFFTTGWDTLTVRPGTFYIVWPQDLHAPRVALGAPGPVTVVVAKVRLD